MGTEVLRPQDCLIERIRQPPVSIYRQNYGNFCNYNKNNHVLSSRSSRKPAKRPERSDKRRRVVVPSQPIPVTSVSKNSSSDDLRIVRGSGITTEKVMILRRGKSLDSKIMSEALTKKEGGVQSIYAGSAFVVSPSPSALPLPSFSKKQPSAAIVVDDSATRDLRRLLRLE